MGTAGELRGYLVPCYLAAAGETWFHFLHGNVPGHQIDFMYRPEVPQGPLCPQHYSHLSRLMSCIEPYGGAEYAFAIGNLSRDDTQHEPGHGGVALIFGLRVRGITDHAGRPDPPFAHAVAIIDRALDAPVLFEAAMAFHRRVLGDAASAEWYRSYARGAAEAPAETERTLADYVATFDDLPRPEPSALSLTWTTGGVTHAGRVVFVHADEAPFDVLARAAARIAAVLYRSDVRWSAITIGREANLPNGVSVRFVPRSAVGPANPAATLHALEEVPEDDEAIARELFGARPVARPRPAAVGWRERYAAGSGKAGGEAATTNAMPPAVEPAPTERPAARAPARRPAAESPQRRRKVVAGAAMCGALALAAWYASPRSATPIPATAPPIPATTPLDDAPAVTTKPIPPPQASTAAPPPTSRATSSATAKAKAKLPAAPPPLPGMDAGPPTPYPPVYTHEIPPRR